jgi:hypothetical protein
MDVHLPLVLLGHRRSASYFILLLAPGLLLNTTNQVLLAQLRVSSTRP